jgi:manganese/zinc/iron transport system permease protein
VIVATLGAGLGHLAAITVPTWFGVDTMSTSGSMAVVTGLLFLAAVVAAPRYGVLTRLLHRTQLSLRIVREDALGLLYRLEEHGVPETANRLRARLGEALAISPLTTRLALRGLQRRGLLDRGPDRYQMTRAGRTVARGLVRSHRLWESYLVKHLALPADHVHPTAMRLEHVTSVAMQEDLAVRTDHPEMDPHGRGIPPDETRSHGGRDEAEATDGR